MGITRHLIPAEGEPLIHRIQRQLQARGARDVTVLCAPERVPTYCRSGMAKHSVPPVRTGDFADHWWACWGAKGRINYGVLPYRPYEAMRIVAEV